MTDEPERKRYHVVKHTFTVVHEYTGTDEQAEFALTENSCSINVIEALHEVCEICESLCNVCCAHTAELVGSFDSLGDAAALNDERQRPIPLSADYWREQMRDYDLERRD